MNKKSITNVAVKDKRVLVRVDFNVPLDGERNITDDKRIVEALPTIEYLMKQGAKIILMSHLGRPKGLVKEEMRLDPVASHLARLLGKRVIKLDDCIGKKVEDTVNAMNPGDVLLLENLRFHKEETDNDPDFAKKLALLGDLYVNDAFGTCHRAHASTEGVTHFLQSVSGFLVQKEIDYFEKINSSPERPFALILGGAKVADKIPVIENMLSKADLILIGGAMAYTFLRHVGKDIGSSRYEADMAPVVASLMDEAKIKKVDILLPEDHIICDNIENPKVIKTTESADIPEGFIAVDIGPKTIATFNKKIINAKTIVWNGPMGIFERNEFSKGTAEIAKAIAESSAISIVGGGDSAAAAKKFGFEEMMSHISTGGGASLEYLEGKNLPGIVALEDL